MTHKLSSIMVEALKLLTANPAGMTLQQLNQAGIKRPTLNALRNLKPPLVIVDGKRYKAVPQPGERYILQQWAEGTWYSVHSHEGEPLHFESKAEAEKQARLLSITSDDIRVILEGSDPEAYTLYSFGKRLIRHRSGPIVEHPECDVQLDTDEETPSVSFVIQQRSRGGDTWELYDEHRWIEVATANQTAQNLSIKDPKHEFRVAYDGSVDLLPLVYVEGETQFDIHILDVLDIHQIAKSLADWLGRDARNLLTLCAGALQYTDKPELRETIEAIITERNL